MKYTEEFLPEKGDKVAYEYRYERVGSIITFSDSEVFIKRNLSGIIDKVFLEDVFFIRRRFRFIKFLERILYGVQE